MMRRCLVIVVMASLVGLGCEASSESPDAKEQESSQSEDESTPAIQGCDWADGSWVLTDCAGDAIDLELTRSECNLQITSTAPAWAGAWGVVKDAGVTLYLPASGGSCGGSWDGATLRGSCTIQASPCSFEAAPK